ncbi:unnamed protein product [Linum trigynum]|uniref:Uncharacterized protein n=1 Tax=Linum trigynum TaxID=586398 RepID=A0AAV2FUU0_9ROSI
MWRRRVGTVTATWIVFNSYILDLDVIHLGFGYGGLHLLLALLGFPVPLGLGEEDTEGGLRCPANGSAEDGPSMASSAGGGGSADMSG